MSEAWANYPKSPLVWLLYGLALASLFIEPFGYSEFDSVIGPGISGPVAKILFCVVLFLAGAAVHKERFDTAMAIRWCVGGYVGLEAILCEPPLVIPARLLPLAVLALGQWGTIADQADGGLLDAIPAPLREALAFVLAVIGTSLAISGFDLHNGAEFDGFVFALILPGLVLLGMSLAIMLTALSSSEISKIVMGGYAVALAIFLAGQLLYIVAGRVPSHDRNAFAIDGVLIAMLLVQVWRQWNQSLALLKIAETFVGAIIVAASLRMAAEASRALDPFFLLVSGPMLLVGLGGVVLGLVLLWSSRLWLLRFMPRSWTRG